MPKSELFTTSDGTNLAADHLPGDGPTVVLLHAGVADRRAWSEVASALNARGAEVVAYDRRGFGETPGSESSFDHLDDLLSVLDEVTDAPAWLVGNSQGGLIALDLALTSPERVAGLVLLAPAISGAPEEEDEDLDPTTLQLAEDIELAEASGDLETANRLEVRLWLDGPAGPDGRVIGDARSLALNMNAIALASVQPDEAAREGMDTWSRLEEIEAPVTVVWGELDIPVVVERCRVLADRLGNTREVVGIPGVAHLPALERPDLVTAVVAEAIGL
jgi:pimeloyl-ACP methyl ester carboxylesterase